MQPIFGGNAKMTVPETYFAFKHKLLDTSCFDQIQILQYNGKLYSLDTRRLFIIKQLQLQGKDELLNALSVKYYESEAQAPKTYQKLRTCKNLDILNVDLNQRSYGSGCCFVRKYCTVSAILHSDLDEHIVRDHLKQSYPLQFELYQTAKCKKCGSQMNISVCLDGRKHYTDGTCEQCKASLRKVDTQFRGRWQDLALENLVKKS
ncbi:unnamed protein product [Didymodactylos carnosus]|uniref:Uncharacterized protein n=1 Tax=Didymodactylos carnosus TaxID=1234261 RepID=A0A815IEV1_9BILA|nr:unnamed protein product [Didymodactylos carnosus]CAF1367388.1 unnamed protein product [Didymodactylos carnosus]CAF3817118.1 unnamed protein product [Didymodactylos carnosus]CAF4250481.1 unnamed protein product [Didymodactylos carnosus]